MPQAETLVTPEMEQHRGVWGDERVSYPVSESDIRKWAIAVYWGETPPRLYWDAEYARGTWRNQHGELVKTRISTGIRY
jgi:N-terminal half of MaoC dehydratase